MRREELEAKRTEHSRARGEVEAHACLGTMYDEGKGVEKDKEKSVYHYKKAAIGGHPQARNNLG